MGCCILKLIPQVYILGGWYHWPPQVFLNNTFFLCEFICHSLFYLISASAPLKKFTVNNNDRPLAVIFNLSHSKNVLTIGAFRLSFFNSIFWHLALMIVILTERVKWQNLDYVPHPFFSSPQEWSLTPVKPGARCLNVRLCVMWSRAPRATPPLCPARPVTPSSAPAAEGPGRMATLAPSGRAWWRLLIKAGQ